MTEVHRPCLELFGCFAVVIGQKAQGLAEAMRGEGGKPSVGEGILDHSAQLARVGVFVARQA